MSRKILATTFTFVFMLAASAYAQLSPWDAVAQMQRGINLGNTLEPPREAGWNNPRAEEYYFDLYQQEGFDFVRVPVRWDEHTSKTAPYKIDPIWMARVEQILDWGLSRGLYVVVNTHHEEWIKSNYSQANRDRFDSIWSQIAVRFQNKSERLLFEIINEPHGLTKVQNDDLHQRAIQLIRKTNPTRIIIFQGHNWGGSDELIQAAIPDDPYLMGSFHSYDPYLFGLEGQGTWGTASDYNAMKAKFDAVKAWSNKNNIPVFLGEFGALRRCDYNSRMRHYKAYVDYSLLNGFAAAAWDDGGDFKIMLRAEKDWDEVKDILIYAGPTSPTSLKVVVHQDSIVKVNWTNKLTDPDSIWVQRRTTTGKYATIAKLAPTATEYLDVKPTMNAGYHYRIIATYNDPEKKPVHSHPVSVFFPKWTAPQRTSFLGAPFAIPGTFEAEDFDKGGNGFTYNDLNAMNVGGAYRLEEGVDIYKMASGAYYIGNAFTGEWCEYTIDVAQDGLYRIEMFTSSDMGGAKYKVSVGDAHSGELVVPRTASSKETKSVPFELSLKAGIQILRFQVVNDKPFFYIDRFAISLISSVQQVAESNFTVQVFRNSNNDALVRVQNIEDIDQLRVLSTSGSSLFNFSNQNKQAEIEFNLPRGIYLIEAQSKGRRSTKKIGF